MPIFTVLSTALASTVIAPGAVIAGTVVSTTVTSCVPVETLPLPSSAVQITGVVPSGKAPGALDVIVTGNTSVAVAATSPIGVDKPVASAVILAGTLSTGAVVSTTLTSTV